MMSRSQQAVMLRWALLCASSVYSVVAMQYSRHGTLANAMREGVELDSAIGTRSSSAARATAAAAITSFRGLSGGAGSEPWFVAGEPTNATTKQWIVLDNTALQEDFLGLGNDTVQTMVNIVKDAVPQERQKGFVKITAHGFKKTTVIEVEIATPSTIISVFVIMYTPIIMGWIAWLHYGQPEGLYLRLLPLTLCTTLIGDNFVNKSLAVLMDAPMAITSAQALAMTAIAAVWLIVQSFTKPIDLFQEWRPLMMWSVVAAMFTIYQLMNHLVALHCSLSERTVFTNLCPVISLIFEVTMMPAALKASSSFKSKLALGSMVVGAILFSIQYPDFTRTGVVVALLMVAVLVPYRLSQRYMLAEAKALPIMVLVLYDGIFLWTPSALISSVKQSNLMGAWEGWIEDSSIPVMLFLSLLTFTGNHICALLLLRVNSATALQVYQNLSNFFVVGLGIMFFGDQVMSSPLVLIGIIICLCSGLWYAIEAQPTAPAELPPPKTPEEAFAKLAKGEKNVSSIDRSPRDGFVSFKK